MKKHNQQSGFGHIGIVIIVLVLVLTGAAGYFVYSRSNSKKDTKTSTSQSSNNSEEIKNEEPKNQESSSTYTYNAGDYAGWKEYCSKAEKACFNYPSDWTATDSSDYEWKQYVGLESAEKMIFQSANNKAVVRWSNPIGPIGGACMLEDNPDDELSILSYEKLNTGQDLYAVKFSNKAKLTGSRPNNSVLGEISTYRVVDGNSLPSKLGYQNRCLGTFYDFYASKSNNKPIYFEAKIDDSSLEEVAIKILKSLNYK